MGEIAKICESHMCMEKATATESYQGKLFNVCQKHKKLIKQQKKVDNNY